MNETVIQGSAKFKSADTVKKKNAQAKHRNSMYWYTILAALITAGWLLSDQELITPEYGVGYWLGIIGGSLMLALLLYPLRKRIRLLHIFGPTRVWFRLHMIFGLVGPLLILYHCNFQLGSLNSRVALYCMLLVAGSGIIGKHFYARIHKGLYGHKTDLRELQQELAKSAEKSHGLTSIMPQLVRRLDELSDQMQGDKVTQTLGVGRSLRWTFTHHFMRLSLWLTARRELNAAAAKSPIVGEKKKNIQRVASAFIRDYTTLLGQVAQFAFYERLFALWHVFHLPIFFMMVLSAIAHVLAVHMY